METKKITINYRQTDNIKELTQEEQKLIEAAIEATGKSYSPYSEYKVGTAVLLDNGKIIAGGNQENSAHPISICAEKVTVSAVKTEYPNAKIEMIAITSKSSKHIIDNPVSPCGSCRQFLSEIQYRQGKTFKVLLHSSKGTIYILDSIDDLLPLKFKL